MVKWSKELIKKDDTSGNDSSNSLWGLLKMSNNYTLTKNNALTHKSTTSKVLDLFSMGGALRTRDEDEIVQLVSQALSEDFVLATKCIMWIRDVRGGQGERKTFRIALKTLSENYPEQAQKLLPLIAEYGRFDDIFCLENVDIKNYILEEISKENSLISKWLPSENAGKKSKQLAKALRKYLGLSSVDYRKMLSTKRKKLNLVETKLTEKKYTDIDYSKVPSKANIKYSETFKKRDEERYNKFLENVEQGKEKINTKTLYPYEIVARARNGNDKTMEVLWNSLPDYTNNDNAIVVADVSGSMKGTPMDVSISLAIYFAEKNEGSFHNKFITFSQNPELQEVTGNNLHQKILNLEKAHWDMNTNIQKVFELILNTAKKNKVDEKDLPSTIYIISDMEFDEAQNGIYNVQKTTNFDEIKNKYDKAGYKMPLLVFWNVNSSQNNVPITENEHGTILVSGSSPTTFKMVMEKTTPKEFMLKVLNSERYKMLEKFIK